VRATPASHSARTGYTPADGVSSSHHSRNPDRYRSWYLVLSDLAAFRFAHELIAATQAR
jgi:hypothetical protein